MKKMYVLALAAVVFSIVAGCKKDTVSPSVVGYWSGTYDATNPYFFLFRSNGTVRILANNADTSLCAKAEGTYTVSDSVRAHFTYIAPAAGIYSLAGKMNDAATSMTGTYGDGTSTGGGGIFSVTK